MRRITFPGKPPNAQPSEGGGSIGALNEAITQHHHKTGSDTPGFRDKKDPRAGLQHPGAVRHPGGRLLPVPVPLEARPSAAGRDSVAAGLVPSPLLPSSPNQLRHAADWDVITLPKSTFSPPPVLDTASP